MSPDLPPRTGEFRLQIHSGDARRRVRSYSFTRRSKWWLWGVAVLLGLPVVAALTLGPWLLWSRLSHRAYRVQVARRALQGDRLQAFVHELAELDSRSRALERRLEKSRRIYALPAVGEVQEPVASAPTVESIYAVTARRAELLIAATMARQTSLDRLLIAIEEHERSHPEEAGKMPARSPLFGAESVLVAGFAARRNPYTQQVDFHAGVDLAAALGTPIRAPAPGVVEMAGVIDRRAGGGWWRLGRIVVLRHGERLVSLYGHCGELAVKAGDRVAPGALLATVGDSGWSTTIHLHYEIRRRATDGRWIPVDPRFFILDEAWEDEERVMSQPEQPPSGAEPFAPGMVH